LQPTYTWTKHTNIISTYQVFRYDFTNMTPSFKFLPQAHSNDNTGRYWESDASIQYRLLSFALRHWCRAYICISKGNYGSFLSGRAQHARNITPLS